MKRNYKKELLLTIGMVLTIGISYSWFAIEIIAKILK
jgi:predicted histidine transporter YuiF (NhaC family)